MRAEMSTNVELVQFECPHCKRTLHVPVKYLGLTGICNHCGGRVTIPRRPPGSGQARNADTEGANSEAAPKEPTASSAIENDHVKPKWKTEKKPKNAEGKPEPSSDFGSPKQWYGEKQEYLEYCRTSYSDACATARSMPELRDFYENDQLDKDDQYLNRALKMDNDDRYWEFLERAVKRKVCIPWPYDKLASAYYQDKDYVGAFNICHAYFQTPYWLVPNWSTTTRKLLTRMENLQKRIRRQEDRESKKMDRKPPKN